ncbi:hypothetical protein LINGRAHAP2_LOCUS29098 [Linum grandiflorum]
MRHRRLRNRHTHGLPQNPPMTHPSPSSASSSSTQSSSEAASSSKSSSLSILFPAAGTA